jgi:hypothetical protein
MRVSLVRGVVNLFVILSAAKEPDLRLAPSLRSG